MTLYELMGDFQTLYEMADDPDVDEQAWFDTIEGIEGEIEDKAEGYAKVIATLSGNADACKAEAKRLNDREKAYRNKADFLKQMLQVAMEETGKTRFKTALFSFNVQKNPPSLKIAEGVQVPERYLIQQEPKVDNAAIKAAAKANDGTLMGTDGRPWAWLESTVSLRIR